MNQPRRNRFLTKTTVAALAVALAAQAFAGGASGASVYATELTQILNHIELMTQYHKQVDQALTQARMYVAMQQQLQNLPASVRDSIHDAGSGVGAGIEGNLNAAQQMANALQNAQADSSTILTEDQRAYSTIKYLKARNEHISPYQYEVGMATLAQQRAGIYAKRLDSYKHANQNLQAQMAAMNLIAAQAPHLKSTVGGLAAVVQTNAILGKQLAGIQQQLQQAGQVQLTQATAAAQRHADEVLKYNQSQATNVVSNRLFGTIGAAPNGSGAPAGGQ